MRKTILITVCSSGIGKSTALYFAKRGWDVVATMRNPDKVRGLGSFSKITLKQMDVTDTKSIERTIQESIQYFGQIDAIVNNAGIGIFGAFEAAKPEQLKNQFDTNVFGMMETIRQILPHFRERKQGRIINISSGVGKVPLPMQTLYAASKFAVEGFSESLYYELASLGIKVKLVIPGNIKTDFFKSLTVTDISNFPDYHAYQKKVVNNIEKLNKTTGASPDHVATVIYKAVTDTRPTLRYMAGMDISLFSKVRKILPDNLFMSIVRKTLEKNSEGNAAK